MHLLKTIGGGTNSVSSSFGSSTGVCFCFFSFFGLGLERPVSSPGISGLEAVNVMGVGSGAFNPAADILLFFDPKYEPTCVSIYDWTCSCQ